MNKDNRPDFNELIIYFPEIELPVNISSEYLSVFSQYNKPIPEILIHEFLISDDNSESEHNHEHSMDDEYIACFKIPGTLNFHAFVYIKISMLNYSYFLHTFDMAGRSIDNQMITSMKSDGDNIIEQAAMIDENHMVWTMSADETTDFGPANSRLSGFRLLNNGEIVVVR